MRDGIGRQWDCGFLQLCSRFLCIFQVLLPVWRLSRTVSQFSGHQLLVALQGELGAHQEAPVEVGEAKNLQQGGHRCQGCTLLLRSLKSQKTGKKHRRAARRG